MHVHAHEGEDAVAGGQVAGSIQIPRPRQVDGDFLRDGGGPAAHDDDAVGQLHGLLDVVGDEDNGLFLLLPDVDEVGAHFQAGDEVERPERFVHVKDFGLGRQGSGDFDALAHAAGQFVGVAVSKTGQPQFFNKVIGACMAFLLAYPLHFQPKGHILQHRHPREKAMILEDHGGTLPAWRFLSGKPDFSSRRLNQPCDQSQQRRFATAAGANDADKLIGGQLQVDVQKSGDGALACGKMFGELLTS